LTSIIESVIIFYDENRFMYSPERRSSAATLRSVFFIEGKQGLMHMQERGKT